MQAGGLGAAGEHEPERASGLGNLGDRDDLGLACLGGRRPAGRGPGDLGRGGAAYGTEAMTALLVSTLCLLLLSGSAKLIEQVKKDFTAA